MSGHGSREQAADIASRLSMAADLAGGVAAACGIDDWPGFVAEVQLVRLHVRRSTAQWLSPHLAAAISTAVDERGLPADTAAVALLRVAADTTSRGPMRVAGPGWWWAPVAGSYRYGGDIEEMAHVLLEADGRRVALQMQARRTLQADGLPVTRSAVIRGAYRLLTRTAPGGLAR